MATSPRAGKREYDRHDGTGRGREVEKRHGSGRGNWGALGDEYTEDQDHAVLDSLHAEAKLDEASPDVVREGDIPEDDKLMTLDEYEQKQKAKQ